jgi:hypothetical protein
VKANAPPPPQAEPVFEIVPSVAKVAQPAAPPALETTRFVVEAVPVFEMLKSVLKALLLVEEDTEKSVDSLVVEAAWIEKRAFGVEVPTPTRPF